MTKKKAEIEYRERYDEKLKEGAQKLLDNMVSEKVDQVYYSRGQFGLNGHEHRELWRLLRINGDIREYKLLELLPEGDGVSEDILEKHGLAENQKNKKNKNILPPTLGKYEWEIRKSKKIYFESTDLWDIHDNINANEKESLTKNETVASIHAEQSIDDGVALWALGDGKDFIIGHKNKRNFFKVYDGEYHGGELSDYFFYKNTNDSSQPIIDGGAGEDFYICKFDKRPGIHSKINLEEESISFWNTDNPLPRGKIINVENITIDSENRATVIGDKKNNIFFKMKGYAEYYGRGGNDTMSLVHGKAFGGSGIDSYIILPELLAYDREIEIDDSRDQVVGQPEVSNIILHHTLEKIKSFTFEYGRRNRGPDGIFNDGTLTVTLNNDDGTITTLFLDNFYKISADNPNQMKLNSQYVFYTNDGFILIPQWPEILERNNFHEKWQFEPLFHAQYTVIHDKKNWEYFDKTKPEDISIILQQDNGQGRGQITVGNRTVTLPKNIKLITEDTSFNDQLVGDKLNNFFYSRRGNDILKGQEGSDSYNIFNDINNNDKKANNRTIWIDNEDKQENPDQDSVILPVPISELNKIEISDGKDIILSHRDRNKGHLKLGLRNFMVDNSFRHINLIDSLGHEYRLDVDNNGNPYLDKPNDEIKATEGHDIISLSDAKLLPGNVFQALAGDDIVVYIGDKNLTLHGGKGDDILIIQGNGENRLYGGFGNDKLYGGDGNDKLYGGYGNDELYGGDGNDIINGEKGEDYAVGGKGDDTYLFRLGDGSLTINDEQGNDKLKFFANISVEQLIFIRDDNKLLIFLRNTPGNSDIIILDNYFRSEADKIESLVLVKDHQEVTYNITTLFENISSFQSDWRPVISRQRMHTLPGDFPTLKGVTSIH